MQKKISIFSFFAGIGILDLAFEKSGYNIVFVNEYDDLFMASYQYARTQMTHLVPLYGYHNDSAERYAKKRGKRKLIQIFLQKHNAYFLQTSNKLHRSVQLYVSLITICLVPTEQKRLLK